MAVNWVSLNISRCLALIYRLPDIVSGYLPPQLGSHTCRAFEFIIPLTSPFLELYRAIIITCKCIHYICS